MTQDALLQELNHLIEPNGDYALAQVYAPQIRFDKHEPFMPLAVGYTVFRSAAPSPSSKFNIEPEGGITIEYAIWWDWEIQHLYELEHVWVYLSASGSIVRVEASAHGSKYVLTLTDGSLPLRGGRVTVYSEPGKHGFAPMPDSFRHYADHIFANCTEQAGKDGIHTSNPFGAAAFGNPTALEHRLAKRYMQRLAFKPTFDFSNHFDLRSIPLIDWTHLQLWIPRRVNWWREQLKDCVPHVKAVFLDSGDTLIDEGTEIKAGEVVMRAEFIPGAADLLQQLRAEGYTLALVADGPLGTFENLYQKQYGLWDIFSAFAISELVGAEKPDARMFHHALHSLRITEKDYERVVMVGNNLSRDIKGANALGLISVWISWSKRRSHNPTDSTEVPVYRIANSLELVNLLEQIELHLPQHA